MNEIDGLALRLVYTVIGALAAVGSKVEIDPAPVEAGARFVFASAPNTNKVMIPVEDLGAPPAEVAAQVEQIVYEAHGQVLAAVLASQ